MPALDVVALRYRSATRSGRAMGDGVPLRQTVRVYPDVSEAQAGDAGVDSRAADRDGKAAGADILGLGRDFRKPPRVPARRRAARRLLDGDRTPRPPGRHRTYQPERSQTVWIVVDAGRLMRARDGASYRARRAVNAAFALAQVASECRRSRRCARLRAGHAAPRGPRTVAHRTCGWCSTRCRSSRAARRWRPITYGASRGGDDRRRSAGRSSSG